MNKLTAIEAHPEMIVEERSSGLSIEYKMSNEVSDLPRRLRSFKLVRTLDKKKKKEKET